MVQDYQLNEIRSPTSPAGELYQRTEVGAQEAFSGDHRRRNERGGVPSYTHSLHIADLEAFSCQAVTDIV